MVFATNITGRIRSWIAGEALERYRFVKPDSTAGQVVYADFGDPTIGTTDELGVLALAVGVTMLHSTGTFVIEVACPVTVGDYLWPTVDGKALSSGPGDPVAMALQAATADGDEIEAMPVKGFLGNWNSYREHFHHVSWSETANLGDWLKTSVDTDTDTGDVVSAGDDAVGGFLSILTNDNALDSESLQLNGEAFKMLTNPLYFRARFSLSDVSAADIAIGLGITDTAILAAITDFIGFKTASNDGNLLYSLEKDSTATDVDTTVDLADGVMNEVGITFDGTYTRIFVDGVYIATALTTNLPNNEALTPSIEVQNAAAAVSTMLVDYLHVDQFLG